MFVYRVDGFSVLVDIINHKCFSPVCLMIRCVVDVMSNIGRLDFRNTNIIKTSRKRVRAYVVHTSMSCQWVVMVWYLFNTFCLK